MAKNNITNSKELIKVSWEKLKGNYWKAFLVLFIYSLINGALNGLSSVGNDGISIVVNIAYLLVTAIVTYGLYHSYSCLYEDGKIEAEMLFHKTKPFARNFVLVILVSLYTLFWSFLFIIPGIVKLYSYCLSFQIANKHPEYSANQCITESRKLMNGHKLKMFATQIKLYIPTIILFVGGAILYMQSIIAVVTEILNNPNFTVDPLTFLANPGFIFMMVSLIPALFVRPLYIMCEVSLYHDICDEFDSELQEELEKKEFEIDELLK